MDADTFRKRVVVKVAKSPAVLLPTVLGAWAAAMALLLGDPASFFGFLGVTGVLAGLGIGATKLILGTESVAAEVMEEARDAKRKADEDRLDAVERRLEKTRDPRTFSDIRLLRQLYKRHADAVDNAKFHVPADVAAMSEQIYHSCVDALERSAALWETAQAMATRQARGELMEKRQQVLDEVAQSVQQWALTLDRLQAAPLQRGDEAGLARLREELDMGLQVARRVEQRMHDLERDLTPRDRAAVRE